MPRPPRSRARSCGSGCTTRRRDRCTWTTARAIDFALFERALIGLPGRLGDRMQHARRSRIDEAIALLDALTHADTLEEFLTLPAYDRLD